MIAKNHATHGQPLRHRKFKGIAFDFAGDWTKNGQPRFFIVSGVTENNCWSSPGLLPTRLGIEHQPSEFPEFRHGWVFLLHGCKTSRPQSMPQSLAV